MHRLLRLLMAIGLIALVACTEAGNGEAAEDEGTGTATEVLEPDYSVAFESPGDGDTVTSPVTLVMSASGVSLEPAGEVAEGTGHLHVMVDTECVEAGEVIPSDDEHIHFGAEPLTERQIELEPGEHTLCLQLGDGVHTATAATDRITITVEE